MHEKIKHIFSLSRVYCSNRCKKTRIISFKEGDANSKFFHGVVASRRKLNPLVCILVRFLKEFWDDLKDDLCVS